MSIAMIHTISMIHQVDITEIPVVVVTSIVVAVEVRVAGSWSTWLDIGIVIAADDKTVIILVVKTISVTFAFILSMELTTIVTCQGNSKA